MDTPKILVTPAAILLPGIIIALHAEPMLDEGGTEIPAHRVASRYAVARHPAEWSSQPVVEFCRERGLLEAQCEHSNWRSTLSSLCDEDEIELLAGRLP